MADQARSLARASHEPALHDELVTLALAELAPGDFFREFLRRMLDALTLPTGTIWTRNDAGDFVQQVQFNPGKLDLQLEGQARALHDDLLRQAIQSAQPIYTVPQEESEDSESIPLTGVGIWVLPLFREGKVHGLLEVWSRPEEGNFLGPALIRFSDIVPVFWQHEKQRQIDQQETWNRIDAFARRIHTSLHPTEVAFLVANEGRQLIGCDRLSVALKQGRQAKIEALSGVEKVDNRSNLVKRMRRLCDRVIAWGEPLRFRGERDDTLPPDLLKELDSYLE
ncbi:MAG: GAF domain-containing protein, partial [Gemmataceae bacterium]